MLPTRKPAHSVGLRLGLACASLLICGAIVAAGVLPLWAQSAAPALPATGVVITEDSRLNMRSGPSIDASLVIKLEPQTEVTVVGMSDDGGWYEVEVNGVGSGWVSAEWVQVGQASSAASTLILVPTPTPGRAAASPSRLGFAALIAPTAVANPPAASAADAADESAAPTVDAAAVTTPASTAGAAQETANAAATGAVDVPQAADVPQGEPAVQAAAAATPEPDVPTAVIQPTRMNVRGGPGTGFPVIAGVDGNTSLVILGASPDRQWYRVQLDGMNDGEQAWVYASLTNVIGPADQIQLVPEAELPTLPEPDPQAAQMQTVSTTSADTNTDANAAAVAAAPPPSGAGFFGYGVQAHMLGGGVGEALNATSDLGFNWIKQQVEWRLFEPTQGARGFGELHGIVNAAGQRNINVLFSVVNSPEWAREGGFDGSVGGPPADPNTYAAFVGAMAAEFCGTALKAIEVWNEQNLHYEWGNKPLDPAEYMNLLRAAYGSIKAACPSMLVISGALTPAGNNPPFAMDDFVYLEGMYQNGLAAVSDGIGAHPSGYNVPASVTFEQACAAIQESGNTFNGACDTPHHSWSFRSTMEGYRNIMVVYGDANKRIWPTEFGWAAGGAFDPRYAYADDNTFEEQAAWTVEAFTMMRNWGWVGPAFLWNLNFRVVADGTEKAQWGIVRNDYSPLPVYEALKAMPK